MSQSRTNQPPSSLARLDPRTRFAPIPPKLYLMIGRVNRYPAPSPAVWSPHLPSPVFGGYCWRVLEHNGISGYKLRGGPIRLPPPPEPSRRPLLRGGPAQEMHPSHRLTQWGIHQHLPPRTVGSVDWCPKTCLFLRPFHSKFNALEGRLPWTGPFPSYFPLPQPPQAPPLLPLYAPL